MSSVRGAAAPHRTAGRYVHGAPTASPSVAELPETTRPIQQHSSKLFVCTYVQSINYNTTVIFQQF